MIEFKRARSADRVFLSALLIWAASGCAQDGEPGAPGAPGSPGSSCTVEGRADGGATLRCADGTSVTLPAPQAAGSCEIEELEQGVKLSCPDGSSVVLDGQGPSPGCSVTQADDGGAVISCPDGSSATIKGTTPTVIPSDGTIVELLAGVTSVGAMDGVGTQTRMDGALDGDFSPDGEFLYFVDTFNMTIRRFGLRTQRVVTLAGTPGRKGADDGVGAAASFEGPRGIAVHPDGVRVFIADGFNCTIRQLELTTLNVTTLAGQPGQCDAADGSFEDARFRLTIGMAMEPTGRYLYLSDRGNHVIRRLDLEQRKVETIAGQLPIGPASSARGAADGPAEQARFNGPGGIALSKDASTLYINDTFNSTIRELSLGTQPPAVRTIAGVAGASGHVDGLGDQARFSVSQGLALAADGLYVAGFHGSIRRIDPSTGEVKTVAGANAESGSADGPALAARFGVAFGILAHPDGRRLYYMDRGNNSIRLYDRLTATVTTVMGAPEPTGWVDGARDQARFNDPGAVWPSADGRSIYILDRRNHVVRRWELERATLTTIAGLPGRAGFEDGAFELARFSSPEGIWGDASGQYLYIADTGNDALRRLRLSDNTVETIAGAPLAQDEVFVDGALAQARFDAPAALIGREAQGQLTLYVADAGSDRVRRVTLGEQGKVETVAGGGIAPDAEGKMIDGVGGAAAFDAPAGLAITADGATLYVADQGHHVIRSIELASAQVVTIAGDVGESDAFDGVGADATFNSPGQLALHPDGERLIVVDEANHAIRLLDLSTKEVTTIVGELGVSGGTGLERTPISSARLYYSSGVCLLGDDVYFTADEALMRVQGLLAKP